MRVEIREQTLYYHNQNIVFFLIKHIMKHRILFISFFRQNMLWIDLVA